MFLMFGVLFWQYKFYSQPQKLDRSYTRTDASGLSYNASKQFLYFYYYLNLYPVISSISPSDFSKQGAKDLLEKHSRQIYMDYDFMVMWGDNLKNLMYFPDAIIQGSAENPSVKTFNTMLFVVALLSILVSFYFVGKLFLGLIFVLLLGSNPFQLFEVYGNQNLFSVHISVLMILLSVNLPLFLSIRKPKYYNEFAVVISGLILGIVAHIRVETTALALSCLIIYLTIPKTKIKKKLIYLLVFIAFLLATNQAWSEYFDYKYQQAIKAVEAVGGNLSPYANYRKNHHTIWHSVYAGFSDFDQKYGYKWSDLGAYNYAEPILVAQGVVLPKDKEVWGMMPEYQRVIKDKVVSQIRDDTKWYLGIIYSRIGALFEKTVPIALGFGGHFIKFAIPKISLVILVVGLTSFLIISKNYFLLKLLAFSFPPSLVIIGIYSGKNITSISVFQIFACAITLYLLLLIINNSLKIIFARRSL